VKRGLIITLAVIVGLIVLFIMIFGGIYNQLVQAEEGVSESWAQVENVYQRRMDLIPNLVETVKGYATHEKDTLQGVVEARSKVSQMNITRDVINDPNALTQFQQAQGALSSALSRLMVVVERYPDLKANQNFLALQTQLEGTENRIAVERRRFNLASRDFNTKIRIFPNRIIAGLGGFEKKAYFEAENGAATAPKVSF
jgi:LemA protein